MQVPKRRIQNENPQADDPKRKFSSEVFHATVKWKFQNECPCANVPEQKSTNQIRQAKYPSESSQAKDDTENAQARGPKQTYQGNVPRCYQAENCQAKDPSLNASPNDVQRTFLNEAFQGTASKPTIPAEHLQANLLKRSSQAEDSKRKSPSKRSSSRWHMFVLALGVYLG